MRLLYFKPSLAWPRESGHDVHCYYMIKALAALGHKVALVTLRKLRPEAVAGLALDQQWALGEVEALNQASPLVLNRLQNRYASYWGVDHAQVRTIGGLARKWGADAVVADGLSVLPYLAGVQGALRVWFAGDEWVWHHLSQAKLFQLRTWSNVWDAAVRAYERAYGPLLDRIWVVSEADRPEALDRSGCEHRCVA